MKNHHGFEGRVALVTGGASGIGAATVERLRAAGAEAHVFDVADGDDVPQVLVAPDHLEQQQVVSVVLGQRLELAGDALAVSGQPIAIRATTSQPVWSDS